MSKNRFYIGKKEMEDESLEVWITERIPLPPTDQICECGIHPGHFDTSKDSGCDDLATTHSYQIVDDRVCYTYLCQPCAGALCSEDYLVDNDYPQTGDGYAVVPKHCA